jgi:hypothetical protein
MADDEVARNIEDALNKIVTTTDQSGNMRKELKKTIYETVSTLRNLFVKIKVTIEEKTKQKSQSESEIKTLKAELDAYNRDNNRTNTEAKQETSTGREREPPRTTSRQVLPPHDHPPRLYADVLADRKDRNFKLSLRTKDNHTPDEMMKLLKAKVNPTEINVGITSLKSLRDGRLIIEVGSKKEIETLGEKIREKCGKELEISIQKLRNPRLVLLNIPTDITLENAKGTLVQQNSGLLLEEGTIEPKFSYTTKRGTRNLVIEVDSGIRRKLLQTKVKLGWAICRVDDYVIAKRCFRCSRFNHTHKECKGEQTCPLCAGNHKLKECAATNLEHKCINCLVYKKHHPTQEIDTAHSSLDKKCPSLIAVLEKYKQNTDY